MRWTSSQNNKWVMILGSCFPFLILDITSTRKIFSDIQSPLCTFLVYFIHLGFPVGSEVKNPPAISEDLDSISGPRRSPGEGNGSPLQYPCLGNPMDRGAWRATVHWAAKIRHDWAQHRDGHILFNRPWDSKWPRSRRSIQQCVIKKELWIGPTFQTIFKGQICLIYNKKHKTLNRNDLCLQNT